MTNDQTGASTEILETDRARRLEICLKSVGRTKEELDENVKILREWLETQKHLPEIPDDGLITNFLFMNNFSIENAKQKIDMYYSIRSLIPELFQNKNPKLPHMKVIWDQSYVVTLPKITDEGCRVTYMTYLDASKTIDPLTFFAHCYNITEIRLHEDVGIGEIIIYDLKNITMSQALLFTPLVLKKLAVVLEKVYNNKLKQLHYLNTNPYFDSVISIVKTLLKPKLVKRIHIHSRKEDLKNFIPARILPKDLGGEEMSLKELNEIWRQKLQQHQSRFDFLDNIKIKEELRPTPLVNDDILGFHGNFKKLNVD